MMRPGMFVRLDWQSVKGQRIVGWGEVFMGSSPNALSSIGANGMVAFG